MFTEPHGAEKGMSPSNQGYDLQGPMGGAVWIWESIGKDHQEYGDQEDDSAQACL